MRKNRKRGKLMNLGLSDKDMPKNEHLSRGQNKKWSKPSKYLGHKQFSQRQQPEPVLSPPLIQVPNNRNNKQKRSLSRNQGIDLLADNLTLKYPQR